MLIQKIYGQEIIQNSIQCLGVLKYSVIIDFRSFLQVDDLQHLSSLQVANTINNSFLEPLRHFHPLQSMNEIDDTTLSVLTVSEIEVYNCLKSLNPSKANGPDDIPFGSLKTMRSSCRCLLWKS